jgi:serine/threonine-protein kinase
MARSAAAYTTNVSDRRSRGSPSSFLRAGEIAQGGMGYVELVVKREGRFERRYARKRLHAQYRGDTAFRTMFMDEARVAGLVNHPNVVGVVDVGEDAEGPYLLMDFVDGVPFAKVIARAAAGGERLPLQIAIRLVSEAARGLHAAHELRAADGTPMNLVHRDVSPQNILVGFDGSVRVTDFGIAKAFGNASQTTTGVLKGTIGYLSPEQLRFEEPDRRSDLFSIGVILYEILSGKRLYENKQGHDGARRTLAEPPPDIGYERDDVPPALVELLFELLAKDRDRRLATAQELVVRLEGVLAGLIEAEGPLEIAAYMKARFEDDRRAQEARLRRLVAEADGAMSSRARRRRRMAGLAVAAAALGFGIAGTVAWRTAGTREAAARPGSARTAWAGGWHSCAIESGALYCWGKNNEAQLGTGNQFDANTRRLVLPRADLASVSLGFFHTCVCDRAGRASCWGRNVEAQLGTPPSPLEKRPVAVPGVVDCAQIAAGALHTCALHRSGRVSCWGKNTDGQTGQPIESAGGARDSPPWGRWTDRPAARPITAPAPVDGVAGAVQIDADGDQSCALLGDGRVLCWGDNRHGQLGDGTTTTRAAPAPVRGLADAVEVAVGRYFACARARTGRVLCWGRNRDGTAGDGTREGRLAPVEVAGLADAVQISAGSEHACALRRGGQIVCWGQNHVGQVGSRVGERAPRPVPVEVADVASLSSGEVHTCARHPGGLVCWGGNATGQLGDGTFDARFAPVSVAGFR